MTSPYIYIKQFFEPKFLEYEIGLSTDTVVKRLNDALNENTDDSSSMPLRGSIDGTEFAMGTISTNGDSLLTASIKGKVIEKQSRTTRLDVYITRNSSTYLTFFLSILAAVCYFILYSSNPVSKAPLLAGLAFLVFGTIFSIWFSNNSSRIVQKQFEVFLSQNDLY